MLVATKQRKKSMCICIASTSIDKGKYMKFTNKIGLLVSNPS